jgi:hypothetical protein
MNALILNRSAGVGDRDTLRRTLQQDLLRRLQLSKLRLDGRSPDGDGDHVSVGAAHYGGVNAIAIDKFEGK